MSSTGRVTNVIKRAPVLSTKDVGNFVNYYGCGSKRTVVCTIESTFTLQPIAYNNGTIENTLYGLLQLRGSAAPGDSGSAVFDAYGRFMGLVVASDDRSTYVMTAQTIQSVTDYEIDYDA